jgi:alkylation response protein AidB-like acyl-CoA dehydrogenase
MTDISEVSVRQEVRAWLEANWSPDLELVTWRNRLIDSGWGEPAWPKAWFGRGLPPSLARVVEHEIDRAGAVGVARTGPRVLAAATILAHGTDEQKRRFLRRILTGEDAWCQLFSEPGSGSDLAAAATRADFRDGVWNVSGQKIWTTSAHHADWGLLLARTDWDAPKHRGLSYFLIEMRQPGVEVRPLRQMNGHASFNEVFLTDAKVTPEDLLGDLGGGWRIAQTTLMHERRSFDPQVARDPSAPPRVGAIYDRERAETAAALEPYKWYPQRAGRVDLVIERARTAGKLADPVIRQEVARLIALQRTVEWTAQRARATAAQGGAPGAESSLGKLGVSVLARAAARVHTLISGGGAMLAADDSELNGAVTEILLSVPAISIAGGTDEIQRNIIAERVLGMPKEASEWDGRPFREVPRNAV